MAREANTIGAKSPDAQVSHAVIEIKAESNGCESRSRTSSEHARQLPSLHSSSPSGAGKTTLTRMLLERCPELSFSVSHTTRTPRADELDGRDYHFVDRDRFGDMVREGAFLEWASVHGNMYGTARAEIDRARTLPGCAG